MERDKILTEPAAVVSDSAAERKLDEQESVKDSDENPVAIALGRVGSKQDSKVGTGKLGLEYLQEIAAKASETWRATSKSKQR